MMRTRTSGAWLVVLLVTALFTPAAARANGLPDDPARAKQLMERALSLFGEPKAWAEAASLMEQSAQLRGATDAEAYECLMYAGRIRTALRQSDRAQQLFEQAAAQALARGAVIQAANAYVDAAFSAQSAKRAADAAALVEKARVLTASPLLPAADRELLLARIE